MLQKIIHRVLKKRHFWRDVGFSELSELYVSNMLHSLAVSLLMVFVPFYLYQHGYGMPAIFIVFVSYFLARVISDVLAGMMVAWSGPKHTMILSCLFQIVSSLLFLTVPDYHWSPWLLGLPWGISSSFFFIAYHVDFSKIKHTDHSGKEIGYMRVMEKIGGISGPLLGGVVGSVFGGEFIFLIATGVLFASLWPLFRTAEPTKTRQKLHVRKLPWRRVRRDFVAWTAGTVEMTLGINLWPLYLSLFVLGGTVYAQLGILSSLSVIASITAAYIIGKLIDLRTARKVLRFSAICNGLLYLVRPLVGSVVPAFGISVASEVTTTGYLLPITKGMYAAVDDLQGLRITYIVFMEAIGSIIKGLFWLLLTLASLVLSTRSVITLGFVCAALASVAVVIERFRALDPNKAILEP